MLTNQPTGSTSELAGLLDGYREEIVAAWVRLLAGLPGSRFASLPVIDLQNCLRDELIGHRQGIQKPGAQTAQVLFMPDSTVRTAEVQPLLTELYSRAFIWFNKEKPGEVFTQGNLLSYISEMTLRDPENLTDEDLLREVLTIVQHQDDGRSAKPVENLRLVAGRHAERFGRVLGQRGRVLDAVQSNQPGT